MTCEGLWHPWRGSPDDGADSSACLCGGGGTDPLPLLLLLPVLWVAILFQVGIGVVYVCNVRIPGLLLLSVPSCYCPSRVARGDPLHRRSEALIVAGPLWLQTG